MNTTSFLFQTLFTHFVCKRFEKNVKRNVDNRASSVWTRRRGRRMFNDAQLIATDDKNLSI